MKPGQLRAHLLLLLALAPFSAIAEDWQLLRAFDLAEGGSIDLLYDRDSIEIVGETRRVRAELRYHPARQSYPEIGPYDRENVVFRFHCQDQVMRVEEGKVSLKGRHLLDLPRGILPVPKDTPAEAYFHAICERGRA